MDDDKELRFFYLFAGILIGAMLISGFLQEIGIIDLSAEKGSTETYFCRD
jgi:hypothetical protein